MLRAHAKITSRLGHRISGSPLNAAHSQNPRHIDGYASDFAPSDRPNLTPTCAPKREVIFAWALRIAIFILSCSAVHAEQIESPPVNPSNQVVIPYPQPLIQYAAPMYPPPPQSYYPSPQPVIMPQPDPNFYPVAPAELPQPSAEPGSPSAAPEVSNIAGNKKAPLPSAQAILNAKADAEMEKLEKMIEAGALNPKTTNSGADLEKKEAEKPAQAKAPTGAQPLAEATPPPAAPEVSNVTENKPPPAQDTLTAKSEVEMEKLEKMIEEGALNPKTTANSEAALEKKEPEKPAQAKESTGTPLGSTLPPPEAAKKYSVSEPNRSAFPVTPEVAIILSHHRFHPEKVRLKEGIQTRLIFTTLNKRPAALIIERLSLQRWLAKEPPPANALEKAKWEVNREISTDRMTEIIIEPERGEYSFHDALTGAKGEIIVE